MEKIQKNNDLFEQTKDKPKISAVDLPSQKEFIDILNKKTKSAIFSLLPDANFKACIVPNGFPYYFADGTFYNKETLETIDLLVSTNKQIDTYVLGETTFHDKYVKIIQNTSQKRSTKD